MKIIVTREQARQYTTNIRTILKNDHVLDLLLHAWKQRIWILLDYRSWEEYVGKEFASVNLNPHVLERTEMVGLMRYAGMSVRAIATSTDLSIGTVHSTLEKCERPHTDVQFRTPEHIEKLSETNTYDVDSTESGVGKNFVVGLDGKTYDRYNTKKHVQLKKSLVDYSKFPASSLGLTPLPPKNSLGGEKFSLTTTHLEQQIAVLAKRIAAVSPARARRVLETVLQTLQTT